MQTSEEHVLVVRRELLEEFGSFQGLHTEVDRYLQAFLVPGNNFFVPRSHAEHDPSLKQLIPYSVFLHGGRILNYTRGGDSGEKRLVSKGSIGIGGHINPQDSGSSSFDHAAYHRAVRREISEELTLGGGFSERAFALINDDSSEVGRVHIGIVHLVDLESDSVAPGEKIIASLGFSSCSELLARRDSLESWSQIVLDGLPDSAFS